MSEKTIWGTVVGVLVGFAVGMFMGAILVTSVNEPRIKEAIERGYGLYCPTNGVFAWKGECDQ